MVLVLVVDGMGGGIGTQLVSQLCGAIFTCGFGNCLCRHELVGHTVDAKSWRCQRRDWGKCGYG